MRSGVPGRIALQPCAYGAAQRRDRSRYGDRNMAGIEVGIAVQRLDDPVAHVTLGGVGPDVDVIAHTVDALDMPDRFFGPLLLHDPVHHAGECDVAVVHGRLHALRHAAVQRKGTRGIPGNVLVSPPKLEPNLDIVGDGADAVYPFRGPLRRQFARVAVDVPVSVTAPPWAATPTALSSTSGSQSNCRVTDSLTRRSASVRFVVMSPSSPCVWPLALIIHASLVPTRPAPSDCEILR